VPGHDFGRVDPKANLRHVVTFTNRGPAHLEVGGFQGSCSCVQTTTRSLRLAPGSTGTLEILVTAGDVSGPFEESLAFTSTDPAHPSGTISLKGTVFRILEAVPDFAVLPVTPDSGTNETVTVRIVNHGHAPVEIGVPKGSHPAFAAALVARRPGHEYDLVIRTTRPLPNGNHYGTFTLPTTSPEVPELKVTAFVPGLAAVVVTPPKLELPANPRPQDRRRTVLVRSTTDHVLTLTDPGLSLDGTRIRIETREPGRLFAVHVEFAEYATVTPGPDSRPMLTLRTNHPQFPVLRVPVVARP
jgi:hypothetical protein